MPYLVYAYAAIWLIHVAYLLSLAIRQRRLAEEIATLRKLLEKL